jgi:capsular exopolysaccharide synthesis family protein
MTGFRTAQEIEHALELPVLGSVEDIGDSSAAKETHQNADLRDRPITPAAQFNNAIGVLRRAIPMVDRNNQAKVIQLTSTRSHEGKSTVSTAIAASAANSGLRVLLVDGSIRFHALSDRLGMGEAAGLSDLLRGAAALQQVIRSSKDARYMVLPGGSPTTSPVSLLATARLKWVFESVKSLFDYVVLDSPPAGIVVDPVILSESCDLLLYVVRWDMTPREAVRHSIRQLSRYKRPSGIIFNRVMPR